MIQLTADDTRQFMQCLLRTDAFDGFLFHEMNLDVLHHYTFDGKINTAYLDTEEKSKYEGQAYIEWHTIKPQINAILKASHTPTSMKITMSLSPKATIDVQNRLLGDMAVYPVQGFLINVQFDGTQVRIITGTNYNQFTLDKSIEKAFDLMIEKFFKRHELLMIQL